MMNTPICDFVRRYAASDAMRLHMPGHKGVSLLGCEPLDITEISGADELFAPDGIIAESEANASEIFGCQTLYSTEGSSLCIRAMLYLAMRCASECGRTPLIAAGRNVHKTFLTAAALLDFPIAWLPRSAEEGHLSCRVTPKTVASLAEKPFAVYVTSPDYLGHLSDIHALAEYCHANDILLMVDNAHGAYLHFLPQTMHPIALGADLCCDSAHKTLPALTGTAYLHIGKTAPAVCSAYAKAAMALYASTSPSYLLLQSLDALNPMLEGEFPQMLQKCITETAKFRSRMEMCGYVFCGEEPMKLTLMPKTNGYRGTELAEILQENGIFCEFADADHIVLMPAPMQQNALRRAGEVLCGLPRRAPIAEVPPPLPMPQVICTPREAVFAPMERLPIVECVGRICAELTLSCPPAVPIVMCGERMDAEAIECMAYYGFTHCNVCRE